ncbi:PPC domain-containing protein [uncultured Arcticibacterium sp.]|uniref:PPC domain-containing protein n=1 Tax=uncultured Arcticibacterium sp. TaxID=2173042 RepID=UPI0030F6DA5D
MKRLLLFIALTANFAVLGQVTNDDINIQVKFVQGYGMIDDDGCCGGNPEQTWISRAREDTNGSSEQLFSKSSGHSNTPNFCYQEDMTSNSWGYTASGEMGTFSSSSHYYDYEVFSWENDSGERCRWDSGDENRAYFWGRRTPFYDPAAEWTEFEETNSSNSTKHKIKHTWRYTKGDKTNPLDFGTISSGTRYHTNHNRSKPSGAGTYLGYNNDWSGGSFRSANDVTYKFTITSSKKVTISTDYSTTNSGMDDSFISLVNSSGTVLEDDDQGGTSYANTSKIVKDLCPGTYTVVVEGWYSSTEGAFSLSVGVADISVTAGSIVNSVENDSHLWLCPGETIPPVTNVSSASSTVGSVTYKWYRTSTTNGVSSGWAHYTAAGSGATPITLGTMNADVIWIYRQASDCGSSAITSQVIFQKRNPTVSGGTITGGKMIPFPHEEYTNGELASVSDASASPDESISWQESTNNGSTWSDVTFGDDQSYALPELSTTTRFRRKVSNSCNGKGGYNGVRYSNEEEIKVIHPNGVISGVVRDRYGTPGIQGIYITAKRTTSVPGGVVNKEYTTVTGVNGVFDIPDVYYGNTASGSGDQATFEVTPSSPGHGFDPDMATTIVRQSLPQPSGLLFNDTTGFVIAGVVSQECTDCDGASPSNPKVYLMPDVTILESMAENSTPVDNGKLTGQNGEYSTIKLEEGSYYIKPEYETHQFELHQESVAVGGSNGVIVNGIDFKDTTTHVISGLVTIDCNDYYIGRANITFSQVLPDFEGSPVLPTFQKTITTNAGSGAYSVRLPAAKYKVSVNSFSEVPPGKDLNGIEMTAFLNAYPDSIRVRDITNADTTLNLFFHEKPQIVAYGLEGPCNGTSGLTGAADLSLNPIFVQAEERTFTVKVWEGNPLKQCPAQDSTLIMNTNIQVDDVNEELDTMTVNGQIELTLTGGLPNIIPPHHKTLAFVFTDIWGRGAPNLVMTPVVTGLKSNIGTFTTVSPQIPMLILRDPPGDQSFSSWSQGTTIETASRFFAKVGGSTEIWGKVKVGVETQNGIGVSVKSKVWGELGGSLITTGNVKTGNEVVMSTTNSQAFSTSNSNFVTGAKGDVYIGAALNLLYSVTNEVIYSPDTCSLYLRKFLMISTDSLETKYIYSENHIVNTVIPTLRSFINNPGSTQAEKEQWEDQISVWEQTVENNKELKRKARFVENISFDGAGGTITSSTTASSKRTITTEFDLAIDLGVANELGAEIGGAGASGGVKIRVKMETGKSTSNTVTTQTTTGYSIGDQNPGDYFSIDVKTDPVYNTPVFDLIAGTSSCPTEPGTQPRYEVSLTSANPVIAGIPENETGVFQLQIGNTSQSEENRTYWLRHLNASSNGATITKDGNPFNVAYDYQLDYLEQVPVTIGVKRFDPNIYGFENIRFEAIDACQVPTAPFPFTSKEISISAFFANGCSPITLTAPENGFVVSQANNNLLGITMSDYNYANLDEIVVEYAKVGTSNWIEAITVPKAQIQNSSFGTSLNLAVGAIADGEYSFRLKLKCGLDVVYSQRASGVFDRKGPEAFGLPQPADDAYSLGDEISQTFNEALACGSFNASNFTMTRLSNSASIPAILGCFNNKIILTPTVDVLQYLGDSIKVDLFNISDKYGNPATTNYSWKFNVGSPEVDSTVSYYASLNAASSGFSTSSSGFSTSSSISSTATTIEEDEIGSLSVNVTVGTAASDSILVYFIVAGTATYGVDYTVSGAHNFNGNEGSIYIPKGGLLANLQIDPTADTEEELDESIILGILSGGDYNIGGSNKVTLTIINDDTDDCENGGAPFSVNNNTAGNTSISAGEYHKSLLESDGLVQSPTTVIFKGEHSVTLKPGFEVQNGSVFLAIQEDCPNVVTGGGSSGGGKGVRLATANNSAAPEYATYTIENKGRLDKRKGIVQKIAKDGKILIPFASAFEQQFEIELLTTAASKEGDYNSDTIYQSGVNTFSLDTNELETGTYFLKFKGLKDKTESYHKLEVRGN